MNLFYQLNIEEKINFFVKCQELMLKHHPNSPFIIRESSLNKALNAFHDNISQYKGYFHFDDNICILWNHIFIEDPKDIGKILKENAYKEPNQNYNAVSIDFAVFRSMPDCLEFIAKNDSPRIEYVLFIREGKPKIYSKQELIKSIPVKK